MRKPVIILIVIILAVSFIALTYYGFRHARGIPTPAEEIKKIILTVPYLDKEIDLANGISPDIWDSLPPKEISLMYQITILPWGKSLVSPITVKAFYNKKDIYLYISWHDETEDRVLARNKFSDACAIMFPLGKEVQPHTIMMGFLGKANIWQWKASQDRAYWQNEEPKTDACSDYYYPFEEQELFPISIDKPKSAVNDLLAIRVGTVTPKDKQNIQGRGIWDNGKWQVVIKPSTEPINPEEDADIRLWEKTLCAFAVWNGAQGDRGGRKSISDWVELDITD